MGSISFLFQYEKSAADAHRIIPDTYAKTAISDRTCWESFQYLSMMILLSLNFCYLLSKRIIQTSQSNSYFINETCLRATLRCVRNESSIDAGVDKVFIIRLGWTDDVYVESRTSFIICIMHADVNMFMYSNTEYYFLGRQSYFFRI